MIFLILWFIVGLISTIIVWIYNMRGSDYDESYFDEPTILMSLVMIFLGYLSPIILIAIILHSNKFITKFIWKIANIGLKKFQFETQSKHIK